MSKPRKGAMIGCGRVVQDHHVPAWMQLGRSVVDRWTVADPLLQSRAAVQVQLGVPNEMAYIDYRALLLREQPDFVVISSPHQFHETTVIDCLNAGVPVLVEKPVATTLAGAERMVAVSREAGVHLAVLHNYRWMEQARLVRRLLDEGAVGEPFLFRSERIGMYWSQGIEGYDPAWRTKESAGGGCLLDNGYHKVYLALNYLGPVASVQARIGTFNREIEVDDTALLLLTHVNGATSSIQVAWSGSGQSVNVSEVCGRKGSISQEDDGSVKVSCCEEVIRHTSRADAGFLETFRRFIDMLDGRGESPATAEEAVETMRVIRAAYHSARTGTVVDVPGYREQGA
ncbi:MAG: Gfo/Idh/MocA family oxidoreductase [Armatimonadetes bacterium]|nr:Gfo/Idh/MocA family oxidoreductase [Armatimonadota bacterium]